MKVARRARPVIVFGTLLGLVAVASASQVFQDNFDRADNTAIGNNWTEVNTGLGNAQITSSTLVISSGATAGRSYVYQDTTTWGASYKQTLNQTVGLVSWHFNLRANRANLSGF